MESHKNKTETGSMNNVGQKPGGDHTEVLNVRILTYDVFTTIYLI